MFVIQLFDMVPAFGRTVVYHGKEDTTQRMISHANGVSHVTEIPETHTFYFPAYNFAAEVMLDSARKGSEKRPAGLWITWEGTYLRDGMEKISLNSYTAKELNKLYAAYKLELERFYGETGGKTPVAKGGLSFYRTKADPIGAEERMAAALEDAFEEILFGQSGKSI